MFDFALLRENKIVALIEYDGEQHYRPTLRYGGEEKLRLVQERDRIKNEYCKRKGIRLIRVPWFIIDIDAYLDDKLAA